MHSYADHLFVTAQVAYRREQAAHERGYRLARASRAARATPVEAAATARSTGWPGWMRAVRSGHLRPLSH